jgi:hypothetical protein
MHENMTSLRRTPVPWPGTWWDDQDTTVPQEGIQQFYTDLWVTNPDIVLPFNPTAPMEEYMDIQDQGPINNRHTDQPAQEGLRAGWYGKETLDRSGYKRDTEVLMYNKILVS